MSSPFSRQHAPRPDAAPATGGSAARLATPAPVAASVAASVLDAGALARLEAIDPTGKNGVVGKVLRAYQASVARQMPQFDAAWPAGDAKVLKLVAHTLKSSSATIGAIKLAAVCAEIEAMTGSTATSGAGPRAGAAASPRPASTLDDAAIAELAPRVGTMKAELVTVLAAVAVLLDPPR